MRQSNPHLTTADILHALCPFPTLPSKSFHGANNREHAARNAALLHANHAKSSGPAKQLARTAATCASCAAASAVCGSRCVAPASYFLLRLHTDVCKAEILHALRPSLTFSSKTLQQDINHQHAATNAAALHANHPKSLESLKPRNKMCIARSCFRRLWVSVCHAGIKPPAAFTDKCV